MSFWGIVHIEIGKIMFAQNRDHAPLNVVFFTDDNEEEEGRKPSFKINQKSLVANKIVLTMTERSAWPAKCGLWNESISLFKQFEIRSGWIYLTFALPYCEKQCYCAT